MTSLSSVETVPQQTRGPGPKLDHPIDMKAVIVFLTIIGCGLLFAAYNVHNDVETTGTVVRSAAPFLLLGVALVIALGFEFVNGFHDTANAVATVIYTRSLPAQFAVVWSGFFNFLGVLTSTGAVAFGIVSLLPVELILQVGSDAGFAMVFAMLIAAIKSANTMAKPALLPTCRINSTGSSEMMPNATAPEEVRTPARLNRPDQTTAKFAGSERV